MHPIAEIVNKSRWVYGVGIHKRETFLTNICEHTNSNECYLQESEKLLKKIILLPMMLALSNMLNLSFILLLKCVAFRA